MKTRFFKPVVLMLAIIFASCEQSELNSLSDDSKGKASTEASSLLIFTTNISSLTQNDIDGLLLMREEEKMALDVYNVFYETYGIVPFNNISDSEKRHTEAVLALINHFGLTDPALTEPGKFANPTFQALYDQLIAAGSSANLALSTGAFIEEYDIADLKKLIAETTNTDIIRVYNNLLEGSENHLRAFVKALASQGVVYSPQILSIEDFDAIIAGSNSNQGGGKGKGRGFKGGI